MQIRLLNSKDALSYREIRLEALDSHPEAFSSSYSEEKDFPLEHYENRLSLKHLFTYGAFIEDNLAGTVTLIIETQEKVKHRAHITAMYVCPDKRRSGVGRGLVSEAIKNATEMSVIKQVYLTVTSTNEPAKKLYESLGFQTYGIDKRALRVGQTYFDDELMVLHLEPIH